MEKNQRLERLCSDLTKKQQQSEKNIHFLKCKLEIVQEKYDLMKKNFAKEKFVGVVHKNPKIIHNDPAMATIEQVESSPKNSLKNSNNVYNDITIQNMNLTNEKHGVHLVSLQERRNQRKIMTEKNEEEKIGDDLDIVIEQLRTESLDSSNFSKVIINLE